MEVPAEKAGQVARPEKSPGSSKAGAPSPTKEPPPDFKIMRIDVPGLPAIRVRPVAGSGLLVINKPLKRHAHPYIATREDGAIGIGYHVRPEESRDRKDRIVDEPPRVWLRKEDLARFGAWAKAHAPDLMAELIWDFTDQVSFTTLEELTHPTAGRRAPAWEAQSPKAFTMLLEKKPGEISVNPGSLVRAQKSVRGKAPECFILNHRTSKGNRISDLAFRVPIRRRQLRQALRRRPPSGVAAKKGLLARLREGGMPGEIVRAIGGFLAWLRREIEVTPPGAPYVAFPASLLHTAGHELASWVLRGASETFEDPVCSATILVFRSAIEKARKGENVDFEKLLNINFQVLFRALFPAESSESSPPGGSGSPR